MRPTVIVTGDIVLDCHLYGGVKTAATSFSEPGTRYEQSLGGAELTRRLLHASAKASGDAWEAESALLVQDEGHTLPGHLRSFGVWSPRAGTKSGDPAVWRIDRHFGYGPSSAVASDAFRLAPTDRPASPQLTLIDDGAILFRHERFRPFWPEVSTATGFFLLKMGSPLCRGDLWPALAPIMDRLVVVVSANDLRREDIKISRRLSWEQSCEDTLTGLRHDSVGQALLRAAHVIISFGSEGALWVRGGGEHAELIFDPGRLEGEHAEGFDGTAYGFQTSLLVGVASHLMHGLARADALPDGATAHAVATALPPGITAGLVARRALLELGHGVVGRGSPGFPIEALGAIVASTHGGFVRVKVGDRRVAGGAAWTILASEELGHSDSTPLVGLGELTARWGTRKTLSDVPALRRGRLFTVDRGEIESLRTLDGLIRSYVDVPVQKKPLCIGVFGPPGAGKSFGVKALAEGVLGPKVPFLEFNLSQFKGPDDLIGAFHRVRDAVLGGVTPVAFWDEFDSKNYEWLQYLLAPMQDGAFQEGQITHLVGKSLFVFAGGTSATFEQFGIATPVPRAAGDEAIPPEDRREHAERYRHYKLLKGPDFVSRLHGFMNVLGPNPSSVYDLTYPIRRATLLRALLGLGEEELKIDSGLLHALLNVRTYHHGARSFEKIVSALAQSRDDSRISRSGLPRDLSRDTDVADLQRLMDQRSAFKTHADLEALAAAVHSGFLQGAERSTLDAAVRDEPHTAWTIHPAVARTYESLSEDMKASNRAAARRIPDHLALINFVVAPQVLGEGASWREPLEAAIEKHLERLAPAEHLGWWAEREANGWVHGVRDNTLKHHPDLDVWAKLSPSSQDKDRSAIRNIPAVLEVAKVKAIPIGEV